MSAFQIKLYQSSYVEGTTTIGAVSQKVGVRVNFRSHCHVKVGVHVLGQSRCERIYTHHISV
ncbi:MAG: hypothetical protein WCG25_01915 [bacterium]